MTSCQAETDPEALPPLAWVAARLPPLNRGTIGSVTAVEQLLRLARRRMLLLTCVNASVYVSTLLLSTVSLALLIGTKLLDGRLFAAVTAVSLLVAGFQIRRNLPGKYALAQELDLRCGLHDSLSTACHVLDARERHPSAVVQFQLRQAEKDAATVDLKRAFPWLGRKRYLLPVGMALLCCGLLLARYRVSESLDLKPSFLSLLLASDPAAGETASAEKPLSRTVSKPEQQMPPEKKAPLAFRPPQQPSPATSNGDAEGSDTSRNPSEPGQTAGKQSVLQQVRSALSRLFEKVAHGSASTPNGEQQQASTRDGQQQPEPGKTRTAANEQQSATADGKAQKGNQSGTSEAQAKARDGGPGMGNSMDAKPDAKGQGGSQSGAGNENGSQRLMTAEELKAMGKIADLVGKRSSEISGEMTLTNSSAPQELSTEYSNRIGQHRDVESSISEQGVRPEDREYILHYMRAMHELTDKQARATAK